MIKLSLSLSQLMLEEGEEEWSGEKKIKMSIFTVIAP